MANIDIFREKLVKYGCFDRSISGAISMLINTIANDRIPKKLGLNIALSEMITFCSMFRRNLLHPNGSSIPINAITFAITASGGGKDSTKDSMRKNFASGYEIIKQMRRSVAENRAKAEVEAKGFRLGKSDDEWLKHYVEPSPIFAALSTNEGIISLFNENDSYGIGSGYIYSGEIGSELQNNPYATDNLKLLSEMYDMGNKEVKIIKDRDNRATELKGFPVSALFISSPDNILMDDSVKKKFRVEFSGKLSRRSFFSYDFIKPVEQSVSNIDEYINHKILIEQECKEKILQFDRYSTEVAKYHLPKRGEHITISDEAKYLLNLYKEYCYFAKDEISEQLPISKLSREHSYWKAYKLSGAITMMKKRDRVELDDYVEAVKICEILSQDIEAFEADLAKEKYELLITIVQRTKQSEKHMIDIHTLNKLGIITSKNTKSQINELVTFANAADLSGTYKALPNGIEYTEHIRTDKLNVTYKIFNDGVSKEYMAKNCYDGFSSSDVEFKDLPRLLSKSCAYSPYKYKDGYRNKQNTYGLIKWVAIDIDKTEMSIYEMHNTLGDINHILTRTSDNDNPYKYRVILEFDAQIDIPQDKFKLFISCLCNYLGLPVPDRLPSSQCYFSYAGHEVIAETDLEPLNIRDILILFNDESNKIENIYKAKQLTPKKREALLQDRGEIYNAFEFAFNAKDGEGSIMLSKAMWKAKYMGFSVDETIEIINEINQYWVEPMDEDRLEKTILCQIRKWNVEQEAV